MAWLLGCTEVFSEIRELRQQRHGSAHILVIVFGGEDHRSGLLAEPSTSMTNGQKA